ncbi:hypothetical protein ABPG72_010569 [Tetrahymena utriculariae]
MSSRTSKKTCLLLTRALSFFLISMKPQKELQNKILKLCFKFQDKNYASNVPIYNFWTQISVNGVWQSSPRNLEGIMNLYNKLPNFIQKIVEFFGFQPIEMEKMINALRIPSDNDDSGQQKWDQSNNEFQTFYQVVKKYAYRPFDTNHTSKYGTEISNNIDTRTFYYLKNFSNNQKNIKNIALCKFKKSQSLLSIDDLDKIQRIFYENEKLCFEKKQLSDDF